MGKRKITHDVVHEQKGQKWCKKIKIICQEWDSNPCPFGPVPETGALDQLGHLDILKNFGNTNIYLLYKKIHY